MSVEILAKKAQKDRVHTEDMTKLLGEWSAYSGCNLTAYAVYESYRPWADFFIQGSFGIPQNISLPRGCVTITIHAYVCVPKRLDKEFAKLWRLKLVSLPAQEGDEHEPTTNAL